MPDLRYALRNGDPTSTGGVLIASKHHFAHQGVLVGLEGDTATCPACKSDGPVFNDCDPSLILGEDKYLKARLEQGMTLDAETRLLAAIAYGESSTADVYEEMAALASVMVRQQKARGYESIQAFVAKRTSFSFVVNDGNKRYAKLMKATETDIGQSTAMSDAVKAASNALAGGVDYSNGACFWDGADIKTHYAVHAKVNAGIHFTRPEHNIYGIKGSEGKYEYSIKIRKKVKGRIITEKKIIDIFPYTYESTAAAGGTIFWKLGDEWLKISKGKEYL